MIHLPATVRVSPGLTNKRVQSRECVGAVADWRQIDANLKGERRVNLCMRCFLRKVMFKSRLFTTA
jgi:hypothetical protein